MMGNPGLVVEAEFFYSSGETIFFGSRGGVELLFHVDGPGGERINEAELERTVAQGVHSLQVCTHICPTSLYRIVLSQVRVCLTA